MDIDYMVPHRWKVAPNIPLYPGPLFFWENCEDRMDFLWVLCFFFFFSHAWQVYKGKKSTGRYPIRHAIVRFKMQGRLLLVL